MVPQRDRHQILARARVKAAKMARGIHSVRTTKNVVWDATPSKSISDLEI